MANDSTLPFNADFFMILNIAMGGTLGGDIDPSFTEDTMEIDYVKVYQ
jgi:beta-glucanase (GH16 family)